MNSPLSLARPFSVNERLADLERIAADLERIVREQGERIAALEAWAQGEAAAQRSAPLKRRNAEHVAGGARLREAIRAILAAHPGPGTLPAKAVLAALGRVDLGRRKPPVLRTVQLHIRALRAGA